MHFTHPEWLLLLPVIAVLGWQVRALKLWKPLRVLTLLGLTLAISGLELRVNDDGLDLIVLLDQSDSIKDHVHSNQEEWLSLLRNAADTDDTLRVLNFAEAAYESTSSPAASQVVLKGNQTRLNLAIRKALAIRDPARNSRMLVITDGYSTEPISELGELLEQANIPLDYRLTDNHTDNDVALARLSLPQRIQPGEPILIIAEINGPDRVTVPYRLWRNQTQVGKGNLKLNGTQGMLRLVDRLNQPGAWKYRLEITAANDPISENNSLENWIEVVSGPRVLILTTYVNDPLKPLLEKQGFRVEMHHSFSALTQGSLAGTQAVIFNNVPASELPSEFINALPFYVNSQGGGLLMFGGKYSFGSGGYFESPIDPLLPISMELKEEHRKLSVAMSIVLDRSGSMASTTGGGSTKMDLANAGAAQTAMLLGPRDMLSVFAVDSQAHSIVPLMNLEGNRDSIDQRIRKIASTGGGIYVYTGLQAAWKELSKAPTGQRHIILFADAADAEEPGNYKDLIKEMRNNGTTISVIGLGTTSDTDAEFLRDVAQRGGGRIFFNNNPAALPAVFSQETVAFARSTFIEESVGTEAAAGWTQIARKAPLWLPTIDGYNLSYLRPNATSSLFSTDQYKAPLVAFWQRGAGRVAAVTFPVNGKFSKHVRNWKDYGDFIRTLMRWLYSDEMPPGVSLFTQMDGDTLAVDIYYEGTQWEQIFAEEFPEIKISTDSFSEPKTMHWQRMAPGHMRATSPIPAGEPISGAVRMGHYTLPFGPLLLNQNAEWQRPSTRRQDLAAVSRRSGGNERINLTNIWESETGRIFISLQKLLILLALLTTLLDAAHTRVNGK